MSDSPNKTMIELAYDANIVKMNLREWWEKIATRQTDWRSLRGRNKIKENTYS